MLKHAATHLAFTSAALAPPVDALTTIAIDTTPTTSGVRVVVTVDGPNGRTVALQQSPDMAAWQTIATHKFKNAPFVYTAETQARRQFYRAVDQ